MLFLPLTLVLIGIALGLRFRLLILAPATAIGVIITLSAGMACGDHPWSILLVTTLGIVGLQFGYCVGSIFTSAHGSKDATTPAAVRRHAH
jgi:hypothetical protein